jgi:hypothetical protein
MMTAILMALGSLAGDAQGWCTYHYGYRGGYGGGGYHYGYHYGGYGGGGGYHYGYVRRW